MAAPPRRRTRTIGRGPMRPAVGGSSAGPSAKAGATPLVVGRAIITAMAERFPDLHAALLEWAVNNPREAWTHVRDHDGATISARASGDVLDVCLSWGEVEVVTAGATVAVMIAGVMPAIIADGATGRPLRALAHIAALGSINDLPIAKVESGDDLGSTTITVIDRAQRLPR